MEWDLGFAGLAVLAAMSLAFGLLAQVFAGRDTTRWMWVVGAGTFFVLGLLISEAWFGWATEEDLQPNIDGLSRDETLLGIFPGIAVVLLTRRMIRRRSSPKQAGPAPKGGPALPQIERTPRKEPS
jgi:uncharacterized membrane protein YhhN